MESPSFGLSGALRVCRSRAHAAPYVWIMVLVGIVMGEGSGIRFDSPRRALAAGAAARRIGKLHDADLPDAERDHFRRIIFLDSTKSPASSV